MRSTHVHAMWCSGRIITPVSRQSRFGGHELGLAGKTITYTGGRREWVWSDADKAQRTESTRLRSLGTKKNRVAIFSSITLKNLLKVQLVFKLAQEGTRT